MFEKFMEWFRLYSRRSRVRDPQITHGTITGVYDVE